VKDTEREKERIGETEDEIDMKKEGNKKERNGNRVERG
jgi:hypothetical protein